jgi:transposase
MKAPEVVLTAESRAKLQQITRAATSEQREVFRANIVMLAAENQTNEQIAGRLAIHSKTVGKWRSRYAREGIAGLEDRPRSGRPSVADGVARCQIIALTCTPSSVQGSRADEILKGVEETLRKLPDVERERAEEAFAVLIEAVKKGPKAEEAPARTDWTIATLHQAALEAEIARLSKSTVWRILNQVDLRPHAQQMWLHSPDPKFKEKVNEICELYLHPPKGTSVICVDEKRGMQILRRVHPGRPVAPGRLARREFEYERLGTMCLFAGFEVHSGQVFSRLRDGRTAWDTRNFMDELAQWRPKGDVHIIWDNLNTHVSPDVWEAFNQAHGGRFHFHFTPIHASWVNQVECFFSIFQRRVIRRGNFSSTYDFAWKAKAFLAQWNEREAKPFKWTFTGYPLQTGLKNAA